MNLKEMKIRAKTMKSELGLIYLAFKHQRTPWYAKALIALVISYVLSPIDLIPDFIPVLGYLDDLIIAPAGIALAIKLIPEDVILECRVNMYELSKIKMNGTYMGVIIIVIWVIILGMVINALYFKINFVG